MALPKAFTISGVTLFEVLLAASLLTASAGLVLPSIVRTIRQQDFISQGSLLRALVLRARAHALGSVGRSSHGLVLHDGSIAVEQRDRNGVVTTISTTPVSTGVTVEEGVVWFSAPVLHVTPTRLVLHSTDATAELFINTAGGVE